MEGIVALVLCVFALYIFVTVVIPIVVTVSGAILAIIAGFAILVGFCYAVSNYFAAIGNNLNFRSWEWDKDDEPARRSYFFGPGYAQLLNTIKNAFQLNVVSGEKISNTGEALKGDEVGAWGVARAIAGLLYVVVGYICAYVIGTFLCLAIGLIHGSITAILMIITYVIFTIVWVVDRIFLFKNKIHSDCPVCHNRILIPAFMCPTCGAMHKKLVPGPYGIWKHKCTCGEKLPSTFLNGRSKLDAYCPDCSSPMVASDARPIVFQLIGGSKAGKTVYLSAFFHEYLQKLYDNQNLEITIAEQYKPYFDELEEWYSGIDCPSTAQLNSQMYPVLIDSTLGVKRQFSIYDIAGEMFDGYTSDSEIQQQQFHYCDGLLFLIDPFSSGELRIKKINAGEDVSDFSDIAVEDVATNFINYLIRTGHAKANSRCDIPISVLIVKSDVKEVKQAIGPAKIKSIFNNNVEQYETYENARDSICRQFLMDIGMSTTVDNLETQFTNLHYFPVSAMGHSADGTAYEPWCITDAVEWMIQLADKELSDLIIPPVIANK